MKQNKVVPTDAWLSTFVLKTLLKARSGEKLFKSNHHCDYSCFTHTISGDRSVAYRHHLGSCITIIITVIIMTIIWTLASSSSPLGQSRQGHSRAGRIVVPRNRSRGYLLGSSQRLTLHLWRSAQIKTNMEP